MLTLRGAVTPVSGVRGAMPGIVMILPIGFGINIRWPFLPFLPFIKGTLESSTKFPGGAPGGSVSTRVPSGLRIAMAVVEAPLDVLMLAEVVTVVSLETV